MNDTVTRVSDAAATALVPAPPGAAAVPGTGREAAYARRGRIGRRRLTLGNAAVYLLLISYLLIVTYPMFWLACTSLKPDAEVFQNPFSLPSPTNLRWDNFTNAWTKAHFGAYFLNSMLLTVSTVVVTVLLAAMVAFALTRFRSRGAKPLLLFFLGGLMMPLQLAIVPLFFQMKQWHLLNSLPGIFLAYVGFGLPFSIFILAGFFRALPASLHEAARIDGCSEWQAFWHIMLPTARPGLITVAIFLFLGNWNEFFVAFMCLSGEGSESVRTLPLGLANITIVSQYRSDWGVAFAGLVLMMLPTLIVYIALQRHLIKGITAGALKG
ncbi:MAG: carbohydrate ABC transporter permease [Phycisphaeraceae bacterium]